MATFLDPFCTKNVNPGQKIQALHLVIRKCQFKVTFKGT